MLTPEEASQNLTNWAEALAAENNWYPHEYMEKIFPTTGISLQHIFWRHVAGKDANYDWAQVNRFADFAKFLSNDSLDHFILFLLFVAEFIRSEGLTPETFK